MADPSSDSPTPSEEAYEPSEQVNLEIEILASELTARKELELKEDTPEENEPPERPPTP